MGKAKTVFICDECGFETVKWFGKCPDCGRWNTLRETVPKATAVPSKAAKRPEGTGQEPMRIRDIEPGNLMYEKTGIDELDRVLGGGIVEGSFILVGGEPGIGKSTLLLQVSHELAKKNKTVLYISGEESRNQIRLRAKRIGADDSDLLLLAENAMDLIQEKLMKYQPDYCIIDSIQTMYRPEMASAPGSVSQIRECASLLMRHAKENGCGIILVGHVTKDGSLAGPRVLEHMVDVVLSFEGDPKHEYRLLRAVKNRFGSINELGVFEMTGSGMIPVRNPSETLLSQRTKNSSGSCVLCAMEGTRPLLVDVQALCVKSYYTSPRRTVNGLDSSRVILLLAVMEKRLGIRLYDKDVYVNVAGGLDLDEPATDLAVCCAIASSVCDKPIPADWAVMGEVGLAGEVRAIPHMDRRAAECARLGFCHVLCPKQSAKKGTLPTGIELIGADTLPQAFAFLDILPRRGAT